MWHSVVFYCLVCVTIAAPPVWYDGRCGLATNRNLKVERQMPDRSTQNPKLTRCNKTSNKNKNKNALGRVRRSDDYIDVDVHSQKAEKKQSLSIVAGIEAKAGMFPWQAFIEFKGTGVLLCGGCIISKRWILTAAHCLVHVTSDVISVILGELRLNEKNAARQNRHVKKFIAHAKFNATGFWENDIGLIQLEEDIKFGPRIQPVCAPDAANTYAGQTVFASGWGRNASNGTFLQTLHYVTLVTISNAECVDILKTAPVNTNLSDDMICASNTYGGKQRDTCQGDSGGPLVTRNKAGVYSLVGLVSWGIHCASNFPGVYTRVSYFQDWIENTMKN